MGLARERLADLNHCKVSVELVPRVSGGGFRSAPLQYNLRGPDLAKLDSLAAGVVERLKQDSGNRRRQYDLQRN